QYYNFMAAIGDQISDPFTPIEIATTNPIESFSPPIFAAYSRRNGDNFIKLLAKYKKLIVPLFFLIDDDINQLSITLYLSNQQKSKNEYISKNKITMIYIFNDEQFIIFFCCKIEEIKSNTITFDKKDLQVNFISYN